MQPLVILDQVTGHEVVKECPKHRGDPVLTGNVALGRPERAGNRPKMAEE